VPAEALAKAGSLEDRLCDNSGQNTSKPAARKRRCKVAPGYHPLFSEQRSFAEGRVVFYLFIIVYEEKYRKANSQNENKSHCKLEEITIEGVGHGMTILYHEIIYIIKIIINSI